MTGLELAVRGENNYNCICEDRNDMDANGLNAEQQALFASIMGKSPQAGGGAAFSAAQVITATAPVTPAPAAAPAIPADPGRMLSQDEIDALIASMT